MGVRVETYNWKPGADPLISPTLSVCAVIVTYKPAPTFVANVELVAAQVSHVVLVDNGSSAETGRLLLELGTRLGCTLIRNPENLGIAVALNLGVNYALEAGFQWIATFDHDSCVSDGFISRMLETYQQSEEREKIAIVAPTCIDRESGNPIRMLRSNRKEILLAMTSGSMMPASIIREVGTFDESLFMDYVDIEFCLRARQKGKSIVQAPAVLFHKLGQIQFHNFLGFAFGITNHSAERRYYITRNRLGLLMRYGKDWRWGWRESRAMIFDAGKVVLMEDNKWEKIKAMLAGTRDALFGRVGKQVEL